MRSLSVVSFTLVLVLSVCFSGPLNAGPNTTPPTISGSIHTCYKCTRVMHGLPKDVDKICLDDALAQVKEMLATVHRLKPNPNIVKKYWRDRMTTTTSILPCEYWGRGECAKWQCDNTCGDYDGHDSGSWHPKPNRNPLLNNMILSADAHQLVGVAAMPRLGFAQPGINYAFKGATKTTISNPQGREERYALKPGSRGFVTEWVVHYDKDGRLVSFTEMIDDFPLESWKYDDYTRLKSGEYIPGQIRREVLFWCTDWRGDKLHRQVPESTETYKLVLADTDPIRSDFFSLKRAPRRGMGIIDYRECNGPTDKPVTFFYTDPKHTIDQLSAMRRKVYKAQQSRSWGSVAIRLVCYVGILSLLGRIALTLVKRDSTTEAR